MVTMMNIRIEIETRQFNKRNKENEKKKSLIVKRLKEKYGCQESMFFSEIRPNGEEKEIQCHVNYTYLQGAHFGAGSHHQALIVRTRPMTKTSNDENS